MMSEVLLTDGILNGNTFWAHFSTRFISENFSSYIEAGDDSICYAKLDDSVITDDIKDDAIKTKGYFIYPSQLFLQRSGESKYQ